MSLTCGVTPSMIFTASSIMVVDGRNDELGGINVTSDINILNDQPLVSCSRECFGHIPNSGQTVFFHHGLNLAQNLNRVWFGTDSRLE